MERTPWRMLNRFSRGPSDGSCCLLMARPNGIFISGDKHTSEHNPL